MVEIPAFVIGTMVGSFLNVCILRMPKDESIVFPASHCTSCNKPISWYDNVPIVSFLLLRARCRHCKTKISWQYPIVEALIGVLFVVFLHQFGMTPTGFLYLYMALVLFAQSIIDKRYQIIPDQLSLPMIVVGLAVSSVFPEVHGKISHVHGFLAALIGLLAGGGFLWAVGSIAERVLKKEAMGGGDVKLLAGIGAILGWQGVLWTVFVSALLGSVVGIYTRLRKGAELIPYGPFLAVAAFLYLFIGPQVLEWYFGLLRPV